eukprot:CAMPEP_0174721952 /NCGR_PEP_ID=MMETSP1094-20130205/37535_1 /TAXON_ID=156173 /ORGANISM="Chrysochromulina brevifilum, Strain UTEX LB 985" /LENGTH=47 /DNA_ID= /DNA_START= /DNA_END= /DNA_ORIENTATION=
MQRRPPQSRLPKTFVLPVDNLDLLAKAIKLVEVDLVPKHFHDARLLV